MQSASMFGFLNVNKASGLTSRAVVNQIQRLVRPVKVGHAGTLDPLATGVLVVGLGPATRLVSYVQQMPKCYRATFLLGATSDTDDTENGFQWQPDPRIPTREELESTLPSFVGEIQQRPPEYSAIKVDGKRAYALARAGKKVALEARTVRIDGLEVDSYSHPELVVTLKCGSGTYVRSLGRDLAERLGTSAVMSGLQRVSIGTFTLTDAVSVEEVTEESLPDLLVPAGRAVAEMKRIQVSESEKEDLWNGLNIRRTSHGFDEEVAAFDNRGQLVSILGRRDDDLLRPSRNFK